MGQAVPEIPLSKGSKLELNYNTFVLLRAFVLPNFRILLRTLTHLSAYVHVYCRVYLYVYIILAVHCIYTPRVLHFSAFIILCNATASLRSVEAACMTPLLELDGLVGQYERFSQVGLRVEAAKTTGML